MIAERPLLDARGSSTRPDPLIRFVRGACCLVALLFLCGPGWCSIADHTPPAEVADYTSATNGTHPLVPALPNAEGGTLWPFVDLYSGNLMVQTDLLSIDALGPGWAVALYYNSTLSGVADVLGPGWRHSYQIELRIGVPGASDITVEWGDGRADVFEFDGLGWSCDPSLQGRRISSIAGGHSLRTKVGLLYEFDGAGRLTRIIDRNGNALIFAHDGLGRLSTVTDPARPMRSLRAARSNADARPYKS